MKKGDCQLADSPVPPKNLRQPRIRIFVMSHLAKDIFTAIWAAP